MNYSELQQLWIQQRDAFQNWRLGLGRLVHQLRTEVENSLDLPSEKWKEYKTGMERPYVDVIDLHDQKNKMVVVFSDPSYSENGELHCGIQITMEHEPNSFPKTCYYVPVVVKFVNREGQYNFWDSQREEAESSAKWETDYKVFAKAIIKRMEDHFKFDPFMGAPEKSSIGFVTG